MMFEVLSVVRMQIYLVQVQLMAMYATRQLASMVRTYTAPTVALHVTFI